MSFATACGFGLYDMVGNVRGWVEDCPHLGYEVKTPQGKLDAPTDGSDWTAACSDDRSRIVRGGSWLHSREFLRSASRFWERSGYRLADTGFRVGGRSDLECLSL